MAAIKPEPMVSVWDMFAKLIDAEGSILLKTSNTGTSIGKVSPRVTMTQSDKGLALLEWLADNYGGSIDRCYKGDVKRLGTYQWQVVAVDAVEILLERSEPYYLLKQRQARLALDFIRWLNSAKFFNKHLWCVPANVTSAKRYADKMKELNRRGPIVAEN